MGDDWTLRDAQAAVDRWISQWEEGYWPPLANLARLTEEVGELAREINHLEGAKPGPGSAARVKDEMGDLLFVLITLANSLDVDLSTALQEVLQKYQIRDADRFTPRE